MKTTFKITNHVSELISEDEELIGIGFANHGSFAMLNNCSLDYESLTTEEKELADQFLDMMRTKMLTCGESGGSDDSDALGLGGDGSGRES